MAEPLTPRRPEMPDDGPPPRAEDFPGCREVTISREAIEEHDGRIEYWDARSEAAFIAEPTTTYHEYGVQRLARLTERIAMRRGSPIDVIGAADLVVRDADGERQQLLAADQVVYLYPAATRAARQGDRAGFGPSAGCRPGSGLQHRRAAAQARDL